MVRTPAVIASDLDGTLLNDDRTLSERTRKALAAARERGMAVVAVTARTPYGVDILPELHPLADTVICANGAVFYQPLEARMRIWRSIDLALARRAAEAIAAALPGAVFAAETGTGIVGQGPYEDLVRGTHWEFVETAGEVFDRVEQAVKLKVYDPGLTGEEMAEAVRGADLGGLDMCHWGEFGMLDFNAPDTNKATGLAAWCAERGFEAADVVAFGDMPNDVPMLAWAGRSYAMAGAHPEVVAAATATTASNDDDGVAEVIEAQLEEAASTSRER